MRAIRAPCIVQGMRVRMKDIATDLGLSVVTISKVLRNHPDISEETRARVLKRVQDLDYQPNILARSLVTGRSYLIGLIVPDLIHPFFAEIAKAISRVIRPRGYSLIISSSNEDAGLELQEIRQLLARQLDALVIASTAMSGDHLSQLRKHGQPYVLIDRNFPGTLSNFVGVDDVAAGRIATEHLIRAGCRRVAHIRGRKNSTGEGRLKGYKQALQHHRLPYSMDYVISSTSVDTNSRQQGAEAMRVLLQRGLRPDGVFCYNDPLAIGAMDAILDAGLRIPEDVAIIGCGNLHYDSALRIPLSSIDQHSHIIGRRAAEIALDLIGAKEQPPVRSVVLEPALVIRSSTRIPANTGSNNKPLKITPARKHSQKRTSRS
jgi:LacI family transcriptional regulator